MKKLEELSKEEMLSTSGGGERYARFFGAALRYATAHAISPIAGFGLAIYDYYN